MVGTALRVERTYLGGQFASGDGVTLDCDEGISTYGNETVKDSGETHIRGQNDWRGWKVQLRNVEWLIDKIRWVELVQSNGAGLSRGWLNGLAARAQLHS